MKKQKVLFLLILVLALIFVSCATMEVVEKIEPIKDEVPLAIDLKPVKIEAEKSINIVVSENIFASLENRDLDNSDKIVLFNGDLFSNELLTYYLSSTNLSSIALLNSYINDKGFDGLTVALNAYEKEAALYEYLAKNLKIPILAANLVEHNEKLKSYVTLEKDGIKIAVVGFSITKELVDNLYSNGSSILEAIELIEADVKVALVNNSSDLEPLVTSLATQYPVFDLVFSRSNLEEESVATVYLSFDEELSKYQIKDIEVKSKLSSTVAQENPKILEDLNKWALASIGTISETISTRDALFGDSKSVDLIHQIQLENSLAELSITTIPSFDTTLEKGEISIKDIFDFYPVDSYIYTLSLSGREIKNYFEYNYDKWFNQMKSLDDDLINFDINEDYPNYSYDNLSNVNYVVDITKGLNQRVSLKTISKTAAAFSNESIYKVAIPSNRVDLEDSPLLATKLSFEELQSRVVDKSDKSIRSYLIEKFSSAKVTPTVDNNWIVIPNLWVQRGLKTSYPKLFGDR